MVYKCKMCGSVINIAPDMTVAACEYCGTTQTLPRLTDDRRANLYDRANHYRRLNEYDKATSLYEQILTEDRTDAEAYWSLVLCRYGIEYVEDPATHKRKPTMHRAQYASVLADEDYKSALQYADGFQRGIYESEAKEIDAIQKGILEVSRNETPFDVFICYKETDAAGERTVDSVLAQELYYGLVKEGYKVFFSRITLEDKLGSAYEPYIFAALNSSKVMVVLGTSAENFNAVWVKNEWSRYLALIKRGEEKTLIPAYRDMDAYDLPEEFSHLQALDMAKLGFMQDLIRGIGKIVGGGGERRAAPAYGGFEGGYRGGVSASNLVKRAKLALMDKDFEGAKRYCGRALDLDAENADAYFYSLLAGLSLTDPSELPTCGEDFSDEPDYRKALLFGDPKRQDFLRESLKSSLEILQKKEHAEKIALIRENLENRIRAAKDGIAEKERSIDELNRELPALELKKLSVHDKIKRAKTGAWIHLAAIALLIFAIVLAVTTEGSPFSAFFAVLGVIVLIVSEVMMLKYHPASKVTGVTVFVYCLLLLFYDIIGVITMVQTFKLNRLVETSQIQKEIDAKRRVLEGMTAEHAELQAELNRYQDELNSLAQETA